MNKPRAFITLVTIFVVLTVIATGLFVYSNYIEKPYLTYRNLPFPALRAAKAGQPVHLGVERCNSSGVAQSYDTTHSLRNMLNGEVTILPNVAVSIEPGCHRSISKINVIPAGTPPGAYSVFGIASVKGSYRVHHVDWYSEPFEVVKD